MMFDFLNIQKFTIFSLVTFLLIDEIVPLNLKIICITFYKNSQTNPTRVERTSDDSH